MRAGLWPAVSAAAGQAAEAAAGGGKILRLAEKKFGISPRQIIF